MVPYSLSFSLSTHLEASNSAKIFWIHLRYASKIKVGVPHSKIFKKRQKTKSYVIVLRAGYYKHVCRSTGYDFTGIVHVKVKILASSSVYIKNTFSTYMDNLIQNPHNKG